MLKTQLITFLAVCNAKSFSKAADKLFITPSAVIQQINQLENELSVQLFIRTKRGVTLTPEGVFLRTAGLNLQKYNSEIRRELHSISSRHRTICIGTSLMEKSRLLYDIWTLFSKTHPEYDIRMMNIDHTNGIAPEIDMIESVNSNVPWMNEWEFLHVCNIKMGLGFRRGTPLANKKNVTLAEVKACGYPVMTINDGSCQQLRDILNDLEAAGIHLISNNGTDSVALWESSFMDSAFLVPMCWQDVLIDMEVCDCGWDANMPYGIFYRKNASKQANEFMEFVKKVYSAENEMGIVPKL